MHRQWNQGHMAWEEHRGAAWMCRNGMKKAKAQLELNFARDTKNNKNIFYRYVGQKRKIKDNVHPTINEKELVTINMLMKHSVTFFAPVFTGNHSSHVSQGKDWGNEVPLTVRSDQVQDHLRNLNTSNPWDPMRCIPGS